MSGGPRGGGADPALPAAASAAMDATTDAKENASAAALLRERVVRQVLSSDVLNSVKAHLRARLYAELKGPSAGSSTHSSTGAWQRTPLAPPRSPSLQQHILNCLVSEFLLVQRYTYTLSVFLSETGSGTLPRLSRTDLLRLLGVLPESKVHALLTSSSGEAGSTGSASRAAGSDGGDVGADETALGGSSSPASLAERMVATLGVLGGRVSTHAAACQTCDCEDGPSWGGPNWGGGRSRRGSGDAEGAAATGSQQLAARLAAIEEEYKRKSGALESASAASLEDRMAAFQRECDARCAAQLAERLAALREGELAAVREEEASKHAAALAADRAALAAAHQERLAALQKQEEELLERGRWLQREQDQLQEEHLRRVRADEDRLHAWRAEAEAKLAAREAAVRQQAESAQAAARAAEAAREEGERRMAVRLAEVADKDREAAWARAAADAEVGRVATLQRQLAGALEEQGALRQELSSLRAAHQAEAAALRQEAAAQRLEKERVAAAAASAVAAPGLSLSDSARLQQAVRRLMQRVEQLQAELEAGREREWLWRGSAAEAEKLLGKTAKAQDHALQHAEELRLALAAAAREVGDLQQQATLAAAGAEGPLAGALQAACRDAQRWRDAAEARVGEARQAEERLRHEAAQLQQRAVASRAATAAGLQQLLGRMVHGRQHAAAVDDVEGDSSSAEQSPVAAGQGATAAGAGRGSESRAALQPQQQQQQLRQQGQSGFEQQARWPAPAPAAPQPLQAQQQGGAQLLAMPPEPAAAGYRGAAGLWHQPQSQQYQAAHTADAMTPAPAAAASFGLAGSLWQQPLFPQQQQVQPQAAADSAAGEAPKAPPSRTASDILAAYRARQQLRSAGGSGSAPAPGAPTRSSCVSREASSTDEVSSSEDHGAPGAVPGAGGSVWTGGAEGLQGSRLSAAATGSGAAPDADGYYVSDFTTSEDSSKF